MNTSYDDYTIRDKYKTANTKTGILDLKLAVSPRYLRFFKSANIQNRIHQDSVFTEGCLKCFVF